MLRIAGWFLMAVSGGPLLTFAMIAYACRTLEIDSTGIVTVTHWVVAAAVFIAGLALVLKPRREHEDEDTREGDNDERSRAPAAALHGGAGATGVPAAGGDKGGSDEAGGGGPGAAEGRWP